MPISRQRRGVRWIAAQTATYDILIALFASVIGLSSALNYAVTGKRVVAAAVGLGTFGVFVFSFVKQSLGLAAARKRQSSHELEGCLYTLHAVLAPAQATRVRLACNVPVGGEMLEQVTDYIGDQPKPQKIGRQFPVNAGIIGRRSASGRRLRDGASTTTTKLYVRELIRDWNYTEEQARRLNPGVMEWMAVPIADPDRQRVEAVLFLDSTTRDSSRPNASSSS
jgi:hypothetical protein